MTFRGIDPGGLAGLGRIIAARAIALTSTAGRAGSILERHGRWSAADRITTHLTGAARRLELLAADFGWRVRAIAAAASGSGVVPGSARWNDAVLAIGLPPGSGEPVSSNVVSVPALRLLQSLPAAQVAERFATMSEAQAGIAAAAFPEVVGSLDGAPPAVRYAANDILLAAGQAQWRRWLAEDRQILLFDPEGGGRVVEVFGHLETARWVTVVVPGAGNELANFEVPGAGLRTAAANLHRRICELGAGGAATVAWLGYDPPNGLDAALPAAAVAGRRDLAAFADGLAARGAPHVTVIGHSYGSLVAGMAARDRLAADDLVFVGSPGTGLASAPEARLRPGAGVWAGLAAGDPVGVALDPAGLVLPGHRIGRALRRIADLLRGEMAVRHLHFGPNPVHRDFGAREFSTAGSRGHHAYFAPGSTTLDNLALIASGRDVRVVPAD